MLLASIRPCRQGADSVPARWPSLPIFRLLPRLRPTATLSPVDVIPSTEKVTSSSEEEMSCTAPATPRAGDRSEAYGPRLCGLPVEVAHLGADRSPFDWLDAQPPDDFQRLLSVDLQLWRGEAIQQGRAGVQVGQIEPRPDSWRELQLVVDAARTHDAGRDMAPDCDRLAAIWGFQSSTENLLSRNC